MNREKPQRPNWDEEFNQLAQQLAVPSELDLASKNFELTRSVFFDRLQAYVFRSIYKQVEQDSVVVSSYDYKLIMTDVTIDMVRAFAVDATDEADLIESITNYFVNESQGLVGDMNSTASEQITDLVQTADSFQSEYLRSQIDDADDELPLDIRLTNVIIDLHGQSIDDFVKKMATRDSDQ